jgi:hypothetical protein
MYRCERCNQCPPPRTPCKSIAVSKVRYLHPERLHAKKGVAIQKNGKKKAVWIPDPGGWGYQIVQELRMCPTCANIWEKEQAKLRMTVQG